MKKAALFIGILLYSTSLFAAQTDIIIKDTGNEAATVTSNRLDVNAVQSTAASLNATVVQGTAANLQTEALQPTAADLNATIVTDAQVGSIATHRSAISSNDASFPANTTGSITCTGYRLLRIFCNIGGTTPTWDVSLLEWDGAIYYRQDQAKVTVSEDGSFTYYVYGISNVYVLLDGQSGTTPTMTVKYQLIK